MQSLRVSSERVTLDELRRLAAESQCLPEGHPVWGVPGSAGAARTREACIQSAATSLGLAPTRPDLLPLGFNVRTASQTLLELSGGDPAAFNFLVATDPVYGGIAQLERRAGVSFISDLIGGIGSAVGTVAANLPTIANTIASTTGAIQAIQQSLSGSPTQVVINPSTGSPMPAGMMLDAQAQFAAACNADPTGQCQAAIAAALQGGGSMTMPINPNTGTPIAMAGALSGLTGLGRQALMNPTVINALRAVGLGALVGAGEAGVSALIDGAIGGGSVGARGPLLMAWPAMTAYPRGIVLRAPDKPEKRYRSAGAALLLSGDVAAVRRVTKAASRARRGRRRSSASSRPMVMMLPSSGTANVCGSCLTAPCGCK